MERVKFFSVYDLSCGYNLKNSEVILNEYHSGKELKEINDIIELYCIKKFFDNGAYLSSWTPDDITHYEGIINLNFAEVARFFKSIGEENIFGRYNDVDRMYKDEFWELFAKFKVYEKIRNEIFNEFIHTAKVSLYQLLKHKKISEHYGSVIRDYMMEQYSSAELLLNEYEINHVGNAERLSFPNELTNRDKEKIICRYIDSEEANINYLRLIANIQSNKDRLVLSPRTIRNAKTRAEEEETRLFPEGSGITFETSVMFLDSTETEVSLDFDEGKLTATYSKSWIEENLDYATLLNNYIYLFEYVDLRMRCTLVNKLNSMGVFERFLMTTSQYAYRTGAEFVQRNQLASLQMIGYYSQLFGNGVRLEEVIEWFFEKYLLDEFCASNFRVIMPSENTTYLEKCTLIMPAIESALKQFTIFIQEGEVDFELLEIRPQPFVYKDVPSLNEKKYVYGIGDEFSTVTHYLFSNQSDLAYNEKGKEKYDNFCELLCDMKIAIDDYPPYCYSEIMWLIDNGYLLLDESRNLFFKDKNLIIVLKDLYYNEVVCYWHYPKNVREIIDNLDKRKVVQFESSLFSRPEQDYFNYHLKAQFNNGLDLRNKYVHTQPNVADDNEEIHMENYVILLKLFIITVIKINDDFCIADELKNKMNVN